MKHIHPNAIVEAGAELDDDVVVGPFCHVHAGVKIGRGTRLVSHVVVMGRTSIGCENVVHPFAVIGGDAQVKKGGAREVPSLTSDRRCALEIGDANVFRESVTVNTSSGDGGAPTKIGSSNLFMAGCHVAHDVVVGSWCVIANAVQLAGHVTVEDWVTFGGAAGVAQHLHVGENAFVAAGAMCERDVPPFVIAQGDRARVRALNVVGLERRGVSRESIQALREAFARFWGGRELGFEEAVLSVANEPTLVTDPFVARLLRWLRDPLRGVRPARRGR